MPEYIIEIEEDQSDESEIFIGWIRRHSKQLIRCKDCKHRPKQIGEGTQGFNLEFPDWECPCQCEDGLYNWMPKDDWYCGNGERKEE